MNKSFREIRLEHELRTLKSDMIMVMVMLFITNGLWALLYYLK
jgi:hypothetical protein